MSRRILNSEIAKAVAQIWPVTVEELRGPSREHRISAARQAAFLLGQSNGNHDCALIGRFYNRDRSGVRRGIHAACDRQRKESDYLTRILAASDLIDPVDHQGKPRSPIAWPAPVPVLATFQTVEGLI